MARRSSPSLTAFLRRLRQLGVPPTRFVLITKIAAQKTWLFKKRESGGGRTPPMPGARQYKCLRQFRCSTSRFGIGQVAGSNRTPLGLHRIAEKVGGGWPVGAAFKSRRFAGFTWMGAPEGKITTRILWLEGLEPGFNRGGNQDSQSRCIYIHGTNDEPTLGQPASRGCIHLAANDLMPLYDRVPAGTLAWVEA